MTSGLGRRECPSVGGGAGTQDCGEPCGILLAWPRTCQQATGPSGAPHRGRGGSAACRVVRIRCLRGESTETSDVDLLVGRARWYAQARGLPCCILRERHGRDAPLRHRGGHSPLISRSTGLSPGLSSTTTPARRPRALCSMSLAVSAMAPVRPRRHGDVRSQLDVSRRTVPAEMLPRAAGGGEERQGRAAPFRCRVAPDSQSECSLFALLPEEVPLPLGLLPCIVGLTVYGGLRALPRRDPDEATEAEAP